MTFNFNQIGERLRAYRLGSNLSPEEVAERLGISRAALYKYERGEVIKLETIERLAQLLGTSIPSLLGVEVEYFTNAVSFFERMRQLEIESDHVIAHFESPSLHLHSPEYCGHLRQMLIEALPEHEASTSSAHTQIEKIISILEARQAGGQSVRPSILSIVGATAVRRFLRAGLVGTHKLSAAEHKRRRALARREIEYAIDIMENEPMGVQIGVVLDALPNQSFQIFRQREMSVVAVSPFRLGEFPNIHRGIASVTAAEEAGTLYTELATSLWRSAYKGSKGAECLKRILAEEASR